MDPICSTKMKLFSVMFPASSFWLCIILLLFTTFQLCLNANAFTSTNQTDHLALLKFKEAIPIDPYGVLESWNASTHFCNWRGITCGPADQRVIEFNLRGYQLNGILSPHVGNLSFLRSLDLGNNSFRGDIPPELGRLSQLQILVLTNNSFEGEIPKNLTSCFDLKSLNLDGNNLIDKIPIEIGSLKKLVIHCDLKASNVLLDDDMVGHVSDFGISRLVSIVDGASHNQTSTIGIKGTVGYAPPEYGVGLEVSACGDMYSFGILVLEVLTGRRPTDELFEDGQNLHKFVEISFPDNLLQILDPHLVLRDEEVTKVENVVKCLISLFEIGLACSVESPKERKNIVDVIKELHIIRKAFLVGQGSMR